MNPFVILCNTGSNRWVGFCLQSVNMLNLAKQRMFRMFTNVLYIQAEESIFRNHVIVIDCRQTVVCRTSCCDSRDGKASCAKCCSRA